ncbi:hypothetical protein MKX03_027910 [Papaver bracteatum]|nr:hypothetical protein MKX03_027910 [Papaver bracteatum]
MMIFFTGLSTVDPELLIKKIVDEWVPHYRIMAYEHCLPLKAQPHSSGTSGSGATVAPVNQEPSAFDEFDPRSFAPATAPAASNGEVDLLGSLSDALAILNFYDHNI